MSVYMIQAGKRGPVKIGWTTRHASHRMRTMQGENYEDLTLIRDVKTNDKNAEGWFHSQFAENHIRCEWFLFDEKMLTLELPTPIPHVSRFALSPRGVGAEKMEPVAKVLGISVERLLGAVKQANYDAARAVAEPPIQEARRAARERAP